MATFFNRRGRPPHPDILTPSEWRVLELLREGKTNAEVAYELAISVQGVKYHITNMLGKLQVEDRAGLANWTPADQSQRSDRTRWALTPLVPWAAKSVVAKSVVLASVGAVAIGATAVGLLALKGGGEEPTEPPLAQDAVPSPMPAVRDITHLAPHFVDTGHGWRYAIGRVTASDEWVTFTYWVQGDYEGLRPANWPPGSSRTTGLPTLMFSLEPVETSIAILQNQPGSVSVALEGAIRTTPSGDVLESGNWVLTIPLN